MQFTETFDDRFWDQLLPGGLTLTSRRLTGDVVDHVAVAKQRPLKKSELAASQGAYTALDTVFLVPNRLLLNGNPKPRDTVQVGDTTYTVLDVQGRRRDASGQPQSWVLTARDPIIVYDLRDTITIEASQQDYSTPAVARLWPSGSPRGGTILYQDLACRLQPQRAEATDERGLEGQQTTYLVYVSRQLALPNVRECRVVVQTSSVLPTGTTLARMAYHDAETIGGLPVIEAVVEV